MFCSCNPPTDPPGDVNPFFGHQPDKCHFYLPYIRYCFGNFLVAACSCFIAVSSVLEQGDYIDREIPEKKSGCLKIVSEKKQSATKLLT